MKQHADAVVKENSRGRHILKHEGGASRVDLEIVHIFEVKVIHAVRQPRNQIDTPRG